ncbi:MAG: pseudouridine synthase [Acetobacterales bacterium]
MAENVEEAAPPKGERIAKRLARAGLCSRREAERWIEAGRVIVNGEKLGSPARDVSETDNILVDGKPLRAAAPTKLWRYHKPRGLMTTHRDPQGRPTVFDKLPKWLGHVVSVGRLDLNSEGLLLLTNDGALARRLELPSTGWTRRYRVRVYGEVTDATIAALARGITVEGETFGPIRAKVDSRRGDNSWLTVSLQEGRNREIRRAMEHFGLTVSRLIRVAYGPFQLGALPESEIDDVPAKVLREQLGLKKD